MINFLIINILSMIIFNQFKISSTKKIIYFSILNFVIAIIISYNIYQFIEFLIFLISILYLFVNFYTVRYSSLRIRILKDLTLNKEIMTEKDLYLDRKTRLEDGETSFMKKKLFIFIDLLVNVLKRILI
tara:strand:- start:1508 stop:1894 length:387 start_codon:yes stop_codon:yes gene_type:complete